MLRTVIRILGLGPKCRFCRMSLRRNPPPVFCSRACLESWQYREANFPEGLKVPSYRELYRMAAKQTTR